MFENKTKEEIYSTLLQLMGKNDPDERVCAKCCAAPLSEALFISRNLASQYLNELFYEGFLIKVGGRPTSFLVKSELEKKWDTILASSYDTLIDLLEEKNKSNRQERVFAELIGANGSLGYDIEQCKAAVNYPDKGLPILLYGPTGTGKSYIANLLFEYCRLNKLVDKKAEMVTINCAEYASNAEFFLTHLFGYKKGAYTGADKDNSGLLAQADGGMLFFDEVHSLTPECQEKLFLFMDQGIYHMVGDNSKWFKSSTRFVFATTEDPEKALLKTLLRRIPITIKIPSLKERPILEKRQMIQRMLQKESEKLNKPIRISSMAYQYLENYEFKGNVGELKNCLQISVASAYMQSLQQEGPVDVHLSDLPAQLVKNRPDHTWIMDENQRLLTLENIQPRNAPDSQYMMLYKSILQYFQQHLDGMMDQETFFNCVDLKLEQYVNVLFYDENRMHSPQEDITASILMNINKIFFKKYSMNELSNNEIKILTRYFTSILSKGGITASELKKRDMFKALDDRIKQEFPKDHEMAKSFVGYVQNNLNVKMERFEVLMVFFFLRYFHREMQTYKLPVIILAHGYNIASGIAELANSLLHCNIFSAIDMPIESHFDLMTSRLKDYIDKIHHVKEVIVMVDMGSLEEFHNYIENFTDLDVGIINNVTTKLALDVGSMIMNDEPMQRILEEAKRRSEPNFVIVRRRQRRKAILTVCASGYGIACKFATLLENSFPKKLDIDIIPVALESLNSSEKGGIFDKYEVFMMVGTLESKNSKIPFVSIEDIINQNDVPVLQSLFQQLMSEAELEIFNQNIIKNFSLDNLLDYLTILNPEKIIGSVQQIVSELQRRLEEPFSNNLMIGLYLHISCMIERLILSKELFYDQDTSLFEEGHERFIAMIQEVFKPICETYNVTLPIEEIEYIHDYLFKEESVENLQKSVEEKQKKLVELMEEIGFTE